jgi:endogenous inhibitor of DNA gyrase (YacG/DUF329 family)
VLPVSEPRSLACPTCKRPIEWTAAYPWRPFCSERCRMVDLGAWFSEAHAIPGEPDAAGDEAAAVNPAAGRPA